jgi:hypothetical protein
MAFVVFGGFVFLLLRVRAPILRPRACSMV